MFIVGLTGGVSTGKTTVLSMFKEHGIAVIDADEVARKVIEPGTDGWEKVKQYFGEDVILSNGQVNRVMLGEIIFNDINKRKKLNEITHPRIQKAMMKMALSYFFHGHQYIVMELPLLFETGKMIQFMHKIIIVVCEDDQQLERLCKRNEFSVETATKRIKSQMPLHQKVAGSDFVIDNSADIAYTREQTERIIKVLNSSQFTVYFRAVLASICSLMACALIYYVYKRTI